MNQESITFYQKLFDKWILQMENDFQNTTYDLYYHQVITKDIKIYFQKQPIVVTFDLRAAQAILKSLKTAKLMHYGSQERQLNTKRQAYLKIAKILHKKQFIDLRHYAAIQTQINWQPNYLLIRLQNFINFNQVSGHSRIKENWNESMKMPMEQFWQAIHFNQFFFQLLAQIFEITHVHLSEKCLKIADQCVFEAVRRRSIVQSKPKRPKNYSILDSTFEIKDISAIHREDKSEETLFYRELLADLK